MGSGVAKLLRDRDEKVYTEYAKVYHDQGNKLHLGQTIWVVSEPHIVINAITQEFYGREPGRVYVSYDAIRTAFRDINAKLALTHEFGYPVAMPLIGAGLAQGHWPTIAQIIEEECTHITPVVYTLDGVIPT